MASYGGRIWRVPLSGAEPVQIPFEVAVDLELGPELDFSYPVDRARTFVVRQIRDAVPSPVGSDDRLAFAALDRVYVTALPDGAPTRLTDLEVTEAHPTWSPDGRWVAFVTWSPEGGHLYKVPAGGGASVRLTTTPAIYQQPAWAPDGQRIVVVQGPARAYRSAAAQSAPGARETIVWVDAGGGETTPIAPADGRSTPHFAGDPDRIYLHHGEEGLVSVRWDGTDERQHVQVTGRRAPGAEDPIRASLILMAPDGEHALAQLQSDLYVVAVPRVGGEAPTVSVADPDRAIVPVRKLTDIGGQFPAWSGDGRRAHWSIGNAHLVYDLDAARAAEEAAASDAGEDPPDDPVYEPRELRVTVEATRDIPRGSVVLRGARVITMVGNQVIERADVFVEDGLISEVGRRGSIDFPDGTRIIDLSGTTIVPGFVDTHAHLRPSFGVHKMQSWAYLANLAYGVTTTRDPQTGSTDVLTYGDMVEAGTMLGPRIYSTGPGVFVAEQIEDLDHARDVLTRYSDYYDTKTIKMYMSGNRQQRQWIIMAAREQELLPTTEGGPGHEVQRRDAHRRVSGAGALVPDHAALRRRRHAHRRVEDGLHADPARVLRWDRSARTTSTRRRIPTTTPSSSGSRRTTSSTGRTRRRGSGHRVLVRAAGSWTRNTCTPVTPKVLRDDRRGREGGPVSAATDSFRGWGITGSCG